MKFNELPLRTRTLIIIGGVVFVFIFLIVLVAGGFGSSSVSGTKDQGTPADDESAAAELSSTVAQTIKQEAVRNPAVLVHSLARSFAERFGSFSNEADFGNISDLSFFMTPRMQAWATETVSKAREKQVGTSQEEYYGISTRALAVTKDTLDMKKGSGSLTVATQRRETRGTVVRVYQEDLFMELEQVGTAWKIDGAEWVEHREDGE